MVKSEEQNFTICVTSTERQLRLPKKSNVFPYIAAIFKINGREFSSVYFYIFAYKKRADIFDALFSCFLIDDYISHFIAAEAVISIRDFVIKIYCKHLSAHAALNDKSVVV